MKGKTIAFVGVGVAAGVGAIAAAYFIGHEHGAQLEANAIAYQASNSPQAFATWLSNYKNGVAPIVPLPLFGIQ